MRPSCLCHPEHLNLPAARCGRNDTAKIAMTSTGNPG
jgi:hypothetical protein